jgi:hypothetical protein
VWVIWGVCRLLQYLQSSLKFPQVISNTSREPKACKNSQTWTNACLNSQTWNQKIGIAQGKLQADNTLSWIANLDDSNDLELLCTLFLLFLWWKWLEIKVSGHTIKLQHKRLHRRLYEDKQQKKIVIQARRILMGLRFRHFPNDVTVIALVKSGIEWKH